jgi:hypothetical protein
MRRAGVVLLAPALLLAGGEAQAQSFPVVAGSREIQIGASATSLPELYDGPFSAQPELRLGMFVVEGVELQLLGETRVWPLGRRAPKGYGGALQILWFPNLGAQSRNMYLLIGGGGARITPPDRRLESSFDASARAGIGVKVSLEGLGLDFLNTYHLNVEYRGEYLYLNEDEEDYAALGLGDDLPTTSDFVSGVSVGISMVR